MTAQNPEKDLTGESAREVVDDLEERAEREIAPRQADDAATGDAGGDAGGDPGDVAREVPGSEEPPD